MQSMKRIISVFFSDIVNYSKIKKDELYKLVDEFITIIEEDSKSSSNHIFSRTWGDGLFICNGDAAELGEFALKVRDRFRSTNWTKRGFDDNLRVRIGLHLTQAQVITEDGIVRSVVGYGITSTARIEPVVSPDSVYCSDSFEKLASQDQGIRITFKPVGAKELAKEFGKMELFEMRWSHEENDSDKSKHTVVKDVRHIPREITDKDKDDFVVSAYDGIRLSFDESLKVLTQNRPDIQYSLRDVTQQRFWVKIYTNGNQRAGCSIWFGNERMERSILYSNSTASTSSSWNDSLVLEVRDNEIILKPLNNFSFSGEVPDYFTKINEVADYLWNRLIEQIG